MYARFSTGTSNVSYDPMTLPSALAGSAIPNAPTFVGTGRNQIASREENNAAVVAVKQMNIIPKVIAPVAARRSSIRNMNSLPPGWLETNRHLHRLCLMEVSIHYKLGKICMF